VNTKIFIRKPQERNSFRDRQRREVNVKMKVRGMSFEDMNSTEQAQHKM
jgi:hypothetical protein